MTAGPTYDPSTHTDIPVNGPDSTFIDSPLVTCYLKVRIKDYHGLPHGSPSSSPYFSHKLHTSDRYSIAFSFVPKADYAGNDLVIGFDYDHSIKHQLPPGFKYAMKIATSLLDPGLYSDAYCDEPYLYGPALSGLFTLHIGELTSEVAAEEQISQLEKENGGVVEEGGTGSGQMVRDEQNIPTKWKKRRKHFLTAENLKGFTFEKGRMYHCDFFNPHLDFANFALRLPGFSISVAKYIDEKTHHLRYVLRNRTTGEVCFVVFFKLLFGEELEKTLEARKGEKEEAERRESQQLEEAAMQSRKDGGESAVPADGGGNVQASAQSNPSAVRDDKVEEEDASNPASSAVTSLSNNIYAAFVSMGLWNDPSSSSESEVRSNRSPSPKPSGRSLESRVDDMDDATVESYLQSKHGSTK